MSGVNLIVAKFGGTSVASADNLKLVKNIISKNAVRKIVVVSAPGKRFSEDIKVTDLLYKGDFTEVKKRFEKIIEDLNLNIDLKYDFKNVSVDYIASRGEYLMAKIMAKFLDFGFLDAVDIVKFLPNGEVVIDKQKLLKNIKRGVVIPGFYGSDLSGNVKTFSRGGSDITGALLAEAAGADIYENYTDVDGVYSNKKFSAQTKGARPYKKIKYATLENLAKKGANVVHPDAILPVKRANIKMIVKNTFNSAAPGTAVLGR